LFKYKFSAVLLSSYVCYQQVSHLLDLLLAEIPYPVKYHIATIPFLTRWHKGRGGKLKGQDKLLLKCPEIPK